MDVEKIDFRQKVIALCGLKYSGKNTTARQIASQLVVSGYAIREFAFADKLKLEVCEAYGISLTELEANKSFWRPVLQFWGTEFRRIYQKCDSYWVDKLKLELDIFYRHYPVESYAIITDCRYPNEMEFIRANYYASILWVHRTNKDTTGNNTHASENSITPKMCDAVISNTKDIKHLDNEVYCALRALKII